ncbi:polymorphic toxin type 15 domain-containing protein [Pokkaliibacter sp. MBI-7]|uniref:polymorphic toxin type 15 domain-containing protein n=1 Tax=Pokkaliibacter sp. MBI-7 TaxID=3040600 RepID=UPI0024499857|nr:polymorphic toxin type 15 domain-containing protein [Pokkaliibacter sp. MBI-7]MDH2434377.1 polymorphic toxin type 15 domain-containing protein [Pokkaliibacter sp. MBI-7]
MPCWRWSIPPSRVTGLSRAPSSRLRNLPDLASSALTDVLSYLGSPAARAGNIAQMGQAAAEAVDQGKLHLFILSAGNAPKGHGRGYAAITPKTVAMPAGIGADSIMGTGKIGGFDANLAPGATYGISSLGGMVDVAQQVASVAEHGLNLGNALSLVGTVAKVVTGGSLGTAGMGTLPGPIMNLTEAPLSHMEDGVLVLDSPLDISACDLPIEGQEVLGDPVSLATGEEILPLVDARLPGQEGLVWQRLYRSRLCESDVGLGRGWRTPFHTRIEERAGRDGQPASLLYHDEQGRKVSFAPVRSGAFSDQLAEGLRLHRRYQPHRGDDEMVIHFPDGHVKAFTRAEQRGPWRLSLWLTPHHGHYRCDYDGSRLVRIRCGDHTLLRLDYDPSQRLVAVHQCRVAPDPAEQHEPVYEQAVLARYVYNDHGELLRAVDQYGREEQYDYDNGLLICRTLPSGYRHHLHWSGNGPFARCVEQYGDDKSFHYQMHYEEQEPEPGQVHLHTTVTLPDGHSQHYTFNRHGRLLHKVAADGSEERYHYDPHQRLTLHIDADGHYHRYVYDPHGRLSEEHHGDLHLHHVYNDLGQRIATADPLGFRFVREFDARGALVREQQGVSFDDVHHPDQPLASHYHYREGQISQVTGPGQPALHLSYRADKVDSSVSTHRPAAFTNAPGMPLVARHGEQRWRYSYSATGQLTALLSPTREVISWLYNERGQIIRQGRFLPGREDQREETHYQYDTAGRLTRLTLPDGHTEHLAYAGLSQPTALTQADGSSVVLSYNAERQLTGLLRSDQAFFRLRYTAGQRLQSSQHFDERQRHYHWTPGGQLQAIEEGSPEQPGPRIALAYDAQGMMTERHSYARRHDASPCQSDHYQHDVRQRLTAAHNEQARLVWQWRPDNRLAAGQGWYKDPRGDLHEWQLRYDYDEQGRLAELHLPDGTTVQRHYDDHHRLTGLSHQHCPLLQRTLNAFGSETQRTLPGRELPLLSQTFDHRDRLIGQQWTQHDQPRQRQYRYGLHQQLQQHSDSHRGTVNYHYDALRQLQEVHLIDDAGHEQRHAYVFDSFGNPSHIAGQPAEATYDRLTLLGERRYHYDERGNQTEVRSRTGELLQRRVFDALNQLREVHSDSTSAWYDYDPLGRRISKTVATYRRVQEEGDGDDPGDWTRQRLSRRRTHYYWQGHHLLGEQTDGHYRWYLYEPTAQDSQRDSYRPLLLIDHGHAYHYVLDQRGAPMALLDQQGQPVWQAEPDVWGMATVSLDTVANPLRLQGQYWDEESGLHYNRYRYYDPHSGRYISQDPIGLLGGLNPYRYGPNPLSWIDPLGLCAEAIEDITGNGTEPGLLASGGSLLLDMIPGLGTLKAVGQAITGTDWVTGESVERSGELIGAAMSIIPFGRVLSKSAKALDLVEEAARKLKNAEDWLKAGDKVATRATQLMKKYKVPCFTPGKSLKDSYGNNTQKMEKEFYRQLKDQEAGINSMTVGRYLENREILNELREQYGSKKAREILTSGNKAQQAARAKLENEIEESVRTSLRKKGVSPAEMQDLVDAKVKEQMDQLAALHNPDMIAGGDDVIGRVGNANVNSSIGAQWPGKVSGIDSAALEAVETLGAEAMMNVSLERCK